MPLWSDPREITSTRVHAFHHYWLSLRAAGEELPRRSAIDPCAIPALLPYIVIADFRSTPLQVRYRLVGTRVVEVSRLDFTGMVLEQCGFQAEEPDIWFTAYGRVAETRTPVFGRVHIPYNSVNGHLPLTEEFAICPLTRDGQDIFQCIAIEDYLGPDDDLPPEEIRPMRAL